MLAGTRRLKGGLRRVLRLPAGRAATEALWRLQRFFETERRRKSAGRGPTYGPVPGAGGAALRRFLPAVPPELLLPDATRIRELAEHALAHRFDLLGSGFTEVAARNPTEVNRANREESRRIASMLSPGYRPIDWHADFKAGYRWPAETWHRDVPIGHLAGVDVKVPWELGRMQHLPQLVWAHALAAAGGPGFRPAGEYAREFQDQVLDFIAHSPPGFGVNWRSPMDVALRVCNWLVAQDLLRAHGVCLQPDFEAELERSVLAHLRHVADNLEWSAVFLGNHYLSNVVGLLFAAAYLPPGAGVETWLRRAAGWFGEQVREQFGADGSNREASTSYHRLSAEMVVFAAALVRRLGHRAGAVDLDWGRIERMAEFTIDATRPTGRIAQIGDNDSGRFLILRPGGEDLDHRHLVAAIGGLVERKDFTAFAAGFEVETQVVQGLAGGPPRLGAGGGGAARVRIGEPERFAEHLLSSDWQDVWAVASPGLLDRLEVLAYPDFGFWLFRSRRLWLAVRCGPIGQNGVGGHAHNDQLAVELCLDGEELWRDPGTFVYTPDLVERDRYRSVHAHHAPRVAGREPGRLDLGTFALGDEAQARCLYFGELGFVGRHRGYGAPVYRMVAIGPGDRAAIRDRAEGGLRLAPLEPGERPPFSPAYGRREPSD